MFYRGTEGTQSVQFHKYLKRCLVVGEVCGAPCLQEVWGRRSVAAGGLQSAVPSPSPGRCLGRAGQASSLPCHLSVAMQRQKQMSKIFSCKQRKNMEIFYSSSSIQKVNKNHRFKNISNSSIFYSPFLQTRCARGAPVSISQCNWQTKQIFRVVIT